MKQPVSKVSGLLHRSVSTRIANAAPSAKLGVLALCFALLGMLTACGSGESNVVSGNRDGILHYGNGTEPQGLDPQVVTGVPENHIIRALFEGLAVKNPITLEPEPGVAERWEFRDEGRIITFYLNPEAKWSNGDRVTPEDFLFSFERILTPLLGAPYAYMLYPVKNTEAFHTGKLKDFSKVVISEDTFLVNFSPESTALS